MVRAVTVVIIQLMIFATVSCSTISFHSRGTIDLGKVKTVYIESFADDDYEFIDEIVKKLAVIGLESVGDKEKADLVLTWRYSTKTTSVRFLFEEKSGVVSYLAVCNDSIEIGEDATWICIERSLSALDQ
ncbi:hypothetical protein ACFL17_02860 [Pseudomonadota bacterium]